MNYYYYLIVFTIISYLLGSFSSAVWFGKWFHNIDVREHGSKNAGATNMLRVLGPKAALPVFITDVVKAYISVSLVYLMPEVLPLTEEFYQLKILFGAAAVIGHIFPVFSGFRGGKGVASMLGFILALHPLAAGLSLVIFIIIFIISKIVSLSSMITAVFFPIIIYFIEGGNYLTLTIFSIVASILIILTHLKNIKRLLKGEEKKISFKNK